MSTAQTHKKSTILICDDEEGVRRSFKLILSPTYDVCLAKSGLEALRMLKDSAPLAVFLDIRMPKRHGLDILQRIRKLKPSVPVIIVSGYQSVDLANEAFKCGAVDYIPKPFSSKQILNVLEKLSSGSGKI
ncbi:MAG: response regulator [Candidatus Omnitrophica bacterium]|nr:response regulator [Candidatus Omnitrophota bacterium]MBI2174867.1 response regulator [Candidatus Omnitrophota bacterium]MBI3009500.1 response regulator [Candidatus Omnitrophota bacterium]